ncbi:MAG: MaoC family dehydratase N-terminal domain-containing protein [Pseudomonadota bacterium]
MGAFDAWIGRERKDQDRLTPARALQWCSTFDLAPPSDSLMPQGIHFALCTPKDRTDNLGEDGHPLRDDSANSFMPLVPLPRRMWASSRIQFVAPIALGAAIKRSSRVMSITEKEGGSGKLAFVDVEHETHANGTLSVRETQTLVYREAAPADAPLSPPEPGDGGFDASEWEETRKLVPDARLLFRYSALTFNSHRIHYDSPYAREVERYRGLVVHGPLMASLLLQLAARQVGENRLAHFEFRGMSPAIAGEPLHLAMRQAEEGFDLGAFARDGRQVMKANAGL